MVWWKPGQEHMVDYFSWLSFNILSRKDNEYCISSQGIRCRNGENGLGRHETMSFLGKKIYIVLLAGNERSKPGTALNSACWGIWRRVTGWFPLSLRTKQNKWVSNAGEGKESSYHKERSLLCRNIFQWGFKSWINNLLFGGRLVNEVFGDECMHHTFGVQ